MMKSSIIFFVVALLCSCNSGPVPGGSNADFYLDSLGSEPSGGEIPAPLDDTPPPNEPEEPFSCSAEGVTWWSLQDLLSPGPYDVGKQKYTFRDTLRATAENNVMPHRNYRDLVTNVWYPADYGYLGDWMPSSSAPLAKSGGPFPLLIHSHGFMSGRNELDYAGELLASRGFVVAAVDFPLTQMGLFVSPDIGDLVHQPGDVSFVLNNLIGLSMTSTSSLHRAIDPERIALSGVSLGGMTSLLTTYHAGFKDERVKATISLAGPGAMFSDVFYETTDVPLLMIHGDIDAIVDYETNAQATLERAGSKAHLITLEGGTHAGFASLTKLLGIVDNVDSIGCDAIDSILPNDGSFLGALGGEDVGVIEPDTPAPCMIDPLPPGMSPSRQQDLTSAIMYSYLQLHFASSEAVRNSACFFLSEYLSQQAAEVTFE